MGKGENWLDDDDVLRSNPSRSDWLANIWQYARSLERRIEELEARMSEIPQESKAERLSLRFNPEHKLPLDED